MKISFIEPKSKFAGWSFGWMRTLPLLGPVYLATILKKAGHEVEILKESMGKINISSLRNSDVICLSGMTCQAPRAAIFIKEIRKTFPDKKIIVGGVHASFMPEDFSAADHIIIGEAESIIEDIINGKYKEKIIKGNPVENLDNLPFPDYSLIKKSPFPLPITPISTSRGCPFDCNFCSAAKMFGRRYRFRSPKSVIQELQEVKTKKVIFYDDNFFANKERAKTILREMKDTKTTPNWWAEGRVDIAKDEELLKLISETNNMEIGVGFESINPKVLKSLKKGQKPEEVINCVKKLNDYGIKILGLFMGGADDDDKDVFSGILDFVNKYDIEDCSFTILTPLPGTDLYQDMEKKKRLLTKDWEAYDAMHVVFKPKKMSAYDLQNNQIDVLGKFYREKSRWIKFWLANFSQTIPMYLEYQKGKKANEDYLEFLKKADPRKF